MPDITWEDRDIMLRHGQLVARSHNPHSFEAAAENLAICLLEGNVESYNGLWTWFEEGVRNNVKSQDDVNEIQKKLKERTQEIYERNK